MDKVTKYPVQFGRFSPIHPLVVDSGAPRIPSPNADAMRYSGIAHSATKSEYTRHHSKHAQRNYYRKLAHDQHHLLTRDGYYWHHLGYRQESKPITVAPKYSQQLANKARHKHIVQRALARKLPMD